MIILNPYNITGGQLFYFTGGEVASTKLYVWSSSWEGAFESVVDWLSENEPDVFTPWSEILDYLRDTATAMGKDWDSLERLVTHIQQQRTNTEFTQRVQSTFHTIYNSVAEEYHQTDKGFIYKYIVSDSDIDRSTELFVAVLEKSMRELEPDRMSEQELDHIEKLASQYNIDTEEIWPELYGD